MGHLPTTRLVVRPPATSQGVLGILNLKLLPVCVCVCVCIIIINNKIISDHENRDSIAVNKTKQNIRNKHSYIETFLKL